jgi:hypothetical protein
VPEARLKPSASPTFNRPSGTGMTFLAASPSNELLGYFHKSLRDRKNDFVRPCKNEKIWVMTSREGAGKERPR